MKIRNGLALGAVALMMLTAGACQDLEVENTNDPSARTALSSPQTLEALLNSIHLNSMFQMTHGRRSVTDWWSAYAGDHTVDNASYGADSETQLPLQAALNLVETSFHESILRPAWSEWNEGLATANEILWATRIAGVQILTSDSDGDPPVDNGTRMEILAKLMQGTMRGYIANIHDIGFPTTAENIIGAEEDITTAPDPVPYSAYITMALSELDEAISLARSNDFTMPANRNFWFGVNVTDEWVDMVANGMGARLGSSWGRTPDERANAVDWTRVLDYALQGPSVDIYTTATRENSSTRSDHMWRSERQTSSNYHLRANYRLIGLADVSGAHQAWLAAGNEQKFRYLIDTPDRRITGAGGPTTDGKYFRYKSDNPFPTTDHPYKASFYQLQHWKLAAGENTYRDSDVIPIMLAAEMDLTAAEAYIRLGNLAAGVDLINKTRVANGELPPVTTAGVPAGADCVPKSLDGGCGSLMEALHYERRIELLGVDAWNAWMTNRGFENGLPCNAVTQLPRHNRELVSQGIPTYTFGGPGGDFSFECTGGNVF